MLHNEMKMLPNHERKMRNKAIPIFQQAVNEYPELFTEAQAQITAAVYVMTEEIVPFDTRLGNISYFTSDERKQEGRYRQWQEKAGAQAVKVLMFHLWVYSFPLGL